MYRIEGSDCKRGVFPLRLFYISEELKEDTNSSKLLNGQGNIVPNINNFILR